MRAHKIKRSAEEVADSTRQLKRLLGKKKRFYTVVTKWDRREGCAAVKCFTIYKGEAVDLGALISDVFDLGWYDDGSISCGYPSNIGHKLAELFGDKDYIYQWRTV
jgi:hypothetical protein